MSALGVRVHANNNNRGDIHEETYGAYRRGRLALSAGLASAQTQTPQNYDSSGAPQTSGQRSGGGLSGGAATGSSGNSGMTGAPSSTNPQAGGGPGG